MILFKYRAKRLIDNKNWVYSRSIVYYEDGSASLKDESGKLCPINLATLGVCWGMKDKNGKEVYSNHALRNPENGNTYYIEFNTSFGKFELIRNQTDSKLPTCTISALEIIEEE